MSKVNKEVLGWLVHTPATDINFKRTLERAGAETVQAALTEIEGQAGHKVREKALKAQLARLQKPTLAETYAKQENLDPVSEAALEVVEMERLQEESATNEQADRERRMAQCHEYIGRIQSADMFGKLATVSSLLWLQEMKSTKSYRDLPNIGTWDKFCEYLGKSRRLIDEQLLNLETFGSEFLETCCRFSVGYRDLKKLRQLTHEGAVHIDDGMVLIGDEAIPLDADHREDLQAALERVIEAKDEVLREKDAVIRSNEKLLQSKQELIRRQEKDLARYEDTAARKGLTAGEDAFIKRMEGLRISFDGYMLKVDPERTAELKDDDIDEPTPRMVAAYLTTLDYMRKQLLAAYDTAQDMFGSLAMSPEEAVWTQPEE